MQGSINFDGSLIGNITGGGGGGGSEVVITPVLTSGTKIADVTVDGEEKDLFAPTPTPPTPATEVSVTQTLASGTKIGTITVNGVNYDIYSPDYSGDISTLQTGLSTANSNITALRGRVTTAEGNITTLQSDIEGVINQIDGITIYKQILNQDIVSFSAGNSMPIMKLVANISNISGCTEANVTVCGTNIWDEEWEVGSIADNGAYAPTQTIRSKNYNNIKPNTTYRIVMVGGAIAMRVCFYDKNKNFISRTPNTVNVFTTPSNCYYFKLTGALSYGDTYHNDISVNYPSTDTSYHGYNGNTYNVPFVDGDGNTLTIYDGSIDLISGMLIDNDNSTTYLLPANPINDLEGNNNIWSDTGTIANVGYLDILNISM